MSGRLLDTRWRCLTDDTDLAAMKLVLEWSGHGRHSAHPGLGIDRGIALEAHHGVCVMARGDIVYVHSLSKSTLKERGTIQLRRNAEGSLYYVTSNRGEFATWHLYPRGEKWLERHGYVEGDKIHSSVVTHLYNCDMSFTGGPGKTSGPSEPRHASGRSAHHEPFDWAQFNRVEQRLGNVRNDTITLHPDGSVDDVPAMHTFPPRRRDTTQVASTRMAAPQRARSRGAHKDNDLAQLFKDTEKWNRDRQASAAELPLPETKAKPRSPEASLTPGPMRMQMASRKGSENSISDDGQNGSD